MAGHYDRNPFDEEDEVNPFADGGGRGKSSGQSKYSGGAFNITSGSVPPATNSRLLPLPPEPADFYDRDASIDIPLDSAGDFLHAFCGTSLLPLLHGLKRERHPACSRSHRQKCTRWVCVIFHFVGFLLYRFWAILSRVCAKHLGYPASIHVFPRKR